MSDAPPRQRLLERILERDFTWEGLRRRKLAGWRVSPEGSAFYRGDSPGPEATLQDFWRKEQDRLVQTEYGTFTRWHVPPGVTGVERPTANEILDKIHGSIALVGHRGDGKSLLPFAGVGFASGSAFAAALEICAEARSPLDLAHAFVEEQVELRHFVTSHPLYLAQLGFLQDVRIHDCEFDSLEVYNNIFCGDVHLEKVQAKSIAFTSSELGKSLLCFDSSFVHEARFDDLKVADTIWFQSCSFNKGVSCSESSTTFTTWKYCTAPSLRLNHFVARGQSWIIQNQIQPIGGRAEMRRRILSGNRPP